jgi:hypothetical protein
MPQAAVQATEKSVSLICPVFRAAQPRLQKTGLLLARQDVRFY